MDDELSKQEVENKIKVEVNEVVEQKKIQKVDEQSDEKDEQDFNTRLFNALEKLLTEQ